MTVDSDSDSDELFESADEDFDFKEEPHIPTVIDKCASLQKLSKLSINDSSSSSLDSDSKTVSKVKDEQSDTQVSKPNEKIENLDSTLTKPKQKDEKMPSQVTSVKTESKIKDENLKANVNLEINTTALHAPSNSSSVVPNKSKTDLSLSNIPTKVIANETSMKEEANVEEKSNIEEKSNVEGKKNIEEKTNVEDDGWDDWDVDDDIQDYNSNPVANVPTSSNKSNQSVKLKQSPGNVSNRNVGDSKDVDGWDVEVEDGFEIPVEMNKSSSEHSSYSSKSPLQNFGNNKEESWGSWGAWGGMSNILSTATTGVTSITSQVSQGFSQVLGAPDPAELAKLDQESGESPSQDREAVTGESSAIPDISGTGMFSLSQLTKLVETTRTKVISGGLTTGSKVISGGLTTGSKVISGGLDTLETLGKKTMEVLQDGDPGLKKKRAILFPHQDKPVLSQILREVTDRHEADVSEIETELKFSGRRSTSMATLHFESLLDHYQGLAHLEALEIVSKQCIEKLHNALVVKEGDERKSGEVNEFQETLEQIREMCQVDDADPTDDDDDDDNDNDELGFDDKIQDVMRLFDITSKLNCDRIIQVNRKITVLAEQVALLSSCEEMYAQYLHSLAEFTSVAMDVFHKAANLLLLKPKHRTVDETDALTQFTYVLCSRVTTLSSVYAQAMVKVDKETTLLTNVYLEAANSCSYLKDASQLVVPVLQLAAIPNVS